MGYDLIYWTPMSSSYFLMGFILEKYGDLWKKNCCFSGQIRPNWGNTAWADTDRLGSIELNVVIQLQYHYHLFRYKSLVCLFLRLDYGDGPTIR